jgi:hypothetical protein
MLYQLYCHSARQWEAFEANRSQDGFNEVRGLRGGRGGAPVALG